MAIKRSHQCEPGNAPAKHLWDSALGVQTLALEKPALTAMVRRLHGDVILWAGTHSESANSLQQCMVRHSVFLQQLPTQVETAQPSTGPSYMTAQLEALPFKSSSVDGVVLHHALELSGDPRLALREITRVLTPGGRMVICGFNPFSTIGLRRLYARTFNDALSRHRVVSPLRLFDWLLLLGYELDVKPVYCGYGLQARSLLESIDMPWSYKLNALLDRAPTEWLRVLPFGSLMLVSAVKQAVPMKPQRLAKGGRRTRVTVAYPREFAPRTSERRQNFNIE